MPPFQFLWDAESCFPGTNPSNWKHFLLQNILFPIKHLQNLQDVFYAQLPLWRRLLNSLNSIYPRGRWWFPIAILQGYFPLLSSLITHQNKIKAWQILFVSNCFQPSSTKLPRNILELDSQCSPSQALHKAKIENFFLAQYFFIMLYTANA